MDRDMPVFNKVIMNRINQKNMEIHYKHLINIRVKYLSLRSLQRSPN